MPVTGDYQPTDRNVLIDATMTLAAHLLTGEVSFYAPDVMETVYANRLAWGHVAPCPECIGLLAVALGYEPSYAATLNRIARGGRDWHRPRGRNVGSKR